MTMSMPFFGSLPPHQLPMPLNYASELIVLCGILSKLSRIGWDTEKVEDFD